MSGIIIHLTATEIITSTIIYGIVHGIWSFIKWCLRRMGVELRQIVRQHIESGHKDRFKYCDEGSCATPETVSGLTHPAS